MGEHDNYIINHPLNERMRNLQFKGLNPNINLDDFEYICSKLENAVMGRDNLDDWDELGHGAQAIVFGYKDYAIKVFQHGYWRSHDISVLGQLQHLEHVPRLYGVFHHNKEVKAVIMSKVDGYTISSYRYKVRSGKIDNFVSTRFNHVYKELIKDIMRAGFSPDDLHSGNVMIDKHTGLPVIVDFGEFDKKQYGYGVIDKLDFRRHFDTYQTHEEVIYPMAIMINEKLHKEAQGYFESYKDMMLGQIEAIGGLADIGEILHN